MQAEFDATLAWFANPASQVSAHAVIADDGTLGDVLDPNLIAWHARSPANETMLGMELVQPNIGDPISDAQYKTLAWWLVKMSAQFGFALTPASLPEHRMLKSGIADGKTDISPPFDLGRLMAEIVVRQGR